MSANFVIQKKGVKYTVSYDQPQKDTVRLLVDGKFVGEFIKSADGGYLAKSVNEVLYTPKDTFRMAEQYILDRHFLVIRNARGVFEKHPQRAKKRRTLF